jgi:L-glutamine-phosphate cytidylyltransferase
MRALILAAGRGSRMGALCHERPKCFVELGGHRLIERQLAALRHAGISRIGIVRGYRAELFDLADVTYFDNARWAETNMVMSLATAAEWLRRAPVLVSYGDIFYRSEVPRALAGAADPLAISYDRDWQRLWARRFADPLSDAETFRVDAGAALLEIGGKTRRVEDIQGQYMGLLKFTPAAWSATEALLATLEAPVRERLDMTGLLRRLLAGGGLRIGTVATAGDWGEIDQPADVALYEAMIGAEQLRLEPIDTGDLRLPQRASSRV